MNKRLLLAKIRLEFPQIKWRTAKHIVQGMDHYILLLDDTYLFRFPRNQHYAGKLYSETQLLEYLSGKKLGIPIPRYEFVARDQSFAGYRALPGIQMTRQIFDEIPKSGQLAIARQLGRFLSALHATPIEIGKRYQARVYNSRREHREMTSDVDKFLKPRLSKAEGERIDQFLKEFKKCLTSPNRCLTHSDLWAHHLLLHPGRSRLSGVIDFSDRAIGDPAFDFAELWMYGRDFIKEVYQHYSGLKDDQLLDRAFLLFKRVPLKMMLCPLKGEGGNFKKAHRYFRHIFR